MKKILYYEKSMTWTVLGLNSVNNRYWMHAVECGWIFSFKLKIID